MRHLNHKPPSYLNKRSRVCAARSQKFTPAKVSLSLSNSKLITAQVNLNLILQIKLMMLLDQAASDPAAG